MTQLAPIDSNPLLVLLQAVQRYNATRSDQTSSHVERHEAAVKVLQASRHISPDKLDAYLLTAARPR